MKQGRIFHNGSIQDVCEEQGKVKLASGLLLEETQVQWLPPIEASTIFALGLNYADHAAELAFKAPDKPLVFLKGANAITGHRATTHRPADVTYMHYECELAVVIGKQGKNIRREDAYDYVAGYTIANDYAFRDYLENYYRPNLRVKNRDHCTPLGPWLVDRDDIEDPMNLSLSTYINGEKTQFGSTKDMVFDIPELIVYLSEFMTLNPGDIILTGTPTGIADTKVGDVITTEIEGLGQLVNTVVDSETWHASN
ncbi:MAG: fumarylacetoacetate hydrolase family protein [Oceanospirillaceae bacterium]